MAVDPLAGDALDPQSLDRFAYALNDPANFTDPFGLAVFEGGRLQTEFTFNGLAAFDFLVDTGVLDWFFSDFFVWFRRGEIERFLTLSELLALRQGKAAQRPQAPRTRCAGPALITAGNRRHIGRVGAFPGRPIRRDSAVVAPEQFGQRSGQGMRSFSEQISGFVQYTDPQTRRINTFAFNGVRDVIADRSSPTFRADRLAQAARKGGRLLIELPGLPVRNFASEDTSGNVRDGEGNVIIFVPTGVPCPQGTQPR